MRPAAPTGPHLFRTLPHGARSHARPARSSFGRLSVNVVATAGSAAVAALSNLLLVPLFLHYWSPFQYGEWLVLSSLAAYLAGADMGMTNAVINELSQHYCNGELKRFTQAMHTAFCCYLGFACAVTLTALALCRLLPFHSIGVASSQDDAAIAAGLLLAQVAWYFPVSLVLSFHRTVGNYPKTQWLNNLFRVLVVAATATGLALGARFVQIAAIQLGVSIATVGLATMGIGGRYPDLAPGFRRFSTREVRKLFRSGSPFALMTIGNTISQQGPVLVISSALGPLYVTAFSTVRTLANSVRQVVAIFATAAWPELTLTQASGNGEASRAIHRNLVIVSSSLAAAAGATLWFVGPQVIHAWTHVEIPLCAPLIRWFAAQLVLQAPWLASSLASLSVNRNGLLSKLYVASAVAGVVLSTLLIRRFGLIAVPASLVVAEACICSHFVIRDSCLILGDSYRAFALRLWTRVPVLMALSFATAFAISRTPIDSLIVRASAVAVSTALVAASMAWLFWLAPTDRAAVGGKLVLLTQRHFAGRPLA